MTSDGTPGTQEQTIGRYSALARTAMAGGAITDCDSNTFAGGRFGAAQYANAADAADAPEAALRASLGCGNPVAVADLHPGETVLDLGSGGGLDVLLSARRVGQAGVAYGLDASTDMLALARANAERAHVRNARFLHGDIEDIPLPSASVDVVISNCVICLSADKPRVLAEAFRVLRPGGRLGISDIVAEEGFDRASRAEAEEAVACGCATMSCQEYGDTLAAAGFDAISVTITNDAGGGVHSAIVKAAKPASIAGST